MLTVNRNRIVYGFLTIGILLTGLISRRFFGEILFVKTYAGDVLWALMVFFGFAFTFRRWSTNIVTLLTLLFSFSIEISQLHHAPWIDYLRATRLGGLMLGFLFVWSDLLCYSAGALIGAFSETYLISKRYRS